MLKISCFKIEINTCFITIRRNLNLYLSNFNFIIIFSYENFDKNYLHSQKFDFYINII